MSHDEIIVSGPNANPSALVETAAGAAALAISIPSPTDLVCIVYDDTTTRAQRYDAVGKAIERLSEAV